MAVVMPLLPVLAALSGEAGTLQATGMADAQVESRLADILGSAEAIGSGGPVEVGMGPADAEEVAAASRIEAITLAMASANQSAPPEQQPAFEITQAGAQASANPAVTMAMADQAPANPAPEPAPEVPQNVPGILPRELREPDPSAPPAPALLTEDGALSADEALLDGRRRPGEQETLPEPVRQENIGAVRPPPPEAFPTDSEFPVPDRWRLAETLELAFDPDKIKRGNPGQRYRFLDPYNQNVYKGDRPICIPTEEEQERREAAGMKPCGTPKFLGLKGHDWFLALTGISDTIIEQRTFPIPVSVQTTERPGSLDVFGRSHSLVGVQTFLFGGSLIKGMTAFKPPDVEYRVLLALQGNYVNIPERRALFVQPSKKTQRYDHFLGVQELFVDYHIRNVSDRYDFDSVRVGVQPFQADFRGFLFNDLNLGVRFFGNRDNNRFQYNLALFWRLEKDTNSGLNSIVQRPRDDWVFFANLYRQDFPMVGLTSQISATVNINREGNNVEIDDNGFPVRPALLGTIRGRNYDVAYLGYTVDGRIGRVNLTAQAYAALGEDRNSFFTGEKAKIRSWFFAAEPSMDFNWIRVRLAALYASGDSKPYDNTEGGFDAIFENPIFAGADTSYWIRQSIPFAGGGRVIAIQGRNGILNSLRSSKEQGQSNFNNPGTMLLGAGVDLDITPEFRLSTNMNHLWFENTATLQALRVEGSIPKAIGYDVSAAAIYRPKAIQNVVFRLSGAVLQSGKGFRDLFANEKRGKRYYSVLFNGILSF